VIAGIGTDVVDIGRFTRALERSPRLRERLFTEQERQLPVASLAARFAAKEAVVKALGSGRGLHWQEISVSRPEGERPTLQLTGESAATAEARGISAWHVSLSHDGGVATAFVIAEAHP
jgi:holo-[acyl-carrier protein] synthase